MAKCKPRHADGGSSSSSTGFEPAAVAVEAALSPQQDTGSASTRSIPGSPGDNSTLFNGMISPWVNTAVKGAIW